MGDCIHKQGAILLTDKEYTYGKLRMKDNLPGGNINTKYKTSSLVFMFETLFTIAIASHVCAGVGVVRALLLVSRLATRVIT
jgi:hypothetical protein